MPLHALHWDSCYMRVDSRGRLFQHPPDKSSYAAPPNGLIDCPWDAVRLGCGAIVSVIGARLSRTSELEPRRACRLAHSSKLDMRFALLARTCSMPVSRIFSVALLRTSFCNSFKACCASMFVPSADFVSAISSNHCLWS